MPTEVAIRDGLFYINGHPTYEGSHFRDQPMSGRLFNVRMVNATFEDKNPATSPAGFCPDRNTDAFLNAIPQYKACGVTAFTLNLQGGYCGYEGALNSAFQKDGSLEPSYMNRIARVLDACDQQGIAVILGLFYQRQCKVFLDAGAVRNAVCQAAGWLKEQGYRHVLLEIANEYPHGGYSSVPLIKETAGQIELIQLVRIVHPELLVSTSGLGNVEIEPELAMEVDFLLVHANNAPLPTIMSRMPILFNYGKPVVFNEDSKLGAEAAETLTQVALAGGSWGYMNADLNQSYPFTFGIQAGEDAVVYRSFAEVTGYASGVEALAGPIGTGGPHFTIVEPDDGAVVSGNVQWRVDVTAASSLSHMDFLIDRQVVDTRSESPFQYAGHGQLDTSTLTKGVHQLTVRAFGSDGSSREYSIDILV